MFSKIIGSGSFLPENKVTNQDLTELVDTSSDWIESRSGIKQRFFADKNTTSSDLAYFAAVDAIKNANLNITDIDLIIVATTTPDMYFQVLQQSYRINYLKNLFVLHLMFRLLVQVLFMLLLLLIA